MPKGNLSFIKANTYEDEKGRIWEMQPHLKNVFHQPNSEYEIPTTPYSILENPPNINSDYPYLKLLCVLNDGSSYEAILKPNNEYCTKGKELGTYNYATPSGIFGNIKHTFLDIIPHFICSDYK